MILVSLLGLLVVFGVVVDLFLVLVDFGGLCFVYGVWMDRFGFVW